jgi:hypothetical protein
MGVFNCEDRDPRNWKRVGVFRESHWGGATPSAFHITCSMDAAALSRPAGVARARVTAG